MNDAKAEILSRIRAALTGAVPSSTVPRDYIQTDDRPRPVILHELVERLLDYKARVSQVAPQNLAEAMAQACQQYAIQQVAAPTDVPEVWLPPDITVRRDEPPLSHEDLDDCDAVVTGCAIAIAQTGTIILNGGPYQGRRALSLVPDVHLCVVLAEQVVGNVPEGIARLGEYPTRPITFISGPSATSDIELRRVEGVHGPRTLHVFLVTASVV
ncbi:MAG: LutC/YkgG family protein [Ktedonobacterales bacterium]